MRFYALMNFQDVMGFFFPTLLFMIIFGLFLAYSHLYSKDAEERKTEIVGRFAEGIEDRNAPFPLAMILIIAGVVLWAGAYIIAHGVLGVKI